MTLNIKRTLPVEKNAWLHTNFSDIAKGILISAIILSVFLFLLDHTIKYLFFIFGLSLALILILLVYQNDFKLKLRIPSPKLIDYFFVICSILAFTISNLLEPSGEILFPFSIIISFFLPGWVLLRIIGVKDFQRVNLSDLCLSFALSVGLSSVIFLLVLQADIETGKALFGIYAIISLLPVLKDRVFKLFAKQEPKFDSHKEFGIFEIVILLWITIFFVTVISVIYPEMSFDPGLDIVRHFSQSNQILNSPEIYGTIYPIFHSTLATVIVLSSAPMWLFQSGLAYLSLIVVFSFYIMARSYLMDLNTHAHLLATIFFFVFSGLGWIYYVIQSLNLVDSVEYFKILLTTINNSYGDTGYGIGPFLWLWFRPVTLGFTIFFVMLYLLKNNSLSKRNYIIITSLLVGFLAGIHFPELVIFVLLIFGIAVFRPSIKLRLKETTVSILLGLVIWTVLIFSNQYFFDPQYQIHSFQFLIPLGILSGLSLVLITFYKRISFSFKINPKVIAIAALIIYGILLIYWLTNIEEDSTINFLPNLAVPLEYYPVILGVVGGIAIVGSIIVAKKYRDHPIILFLILFIITIVVGKAITYVNLNFFETGYFERRLILFVYVAATLLASVAITHFFKRIKKLDRRILKSLIVGSFVSLIVFGGIFSTYLSIEYNALRLPNISMTNNEISLLSHLSQVDPRSILLTVTDRSKLIAHYANLGDVVDKYRYPLWASEYPEQTLHVISTLNSSTIISLNTQDSKEISKNYEDGYIASHLLKVAPLLYEGQEGQILQIPTVSSPLPESQVALVLPEDSDEIYYAYDILSLGGYNYTTILLADINSLQKARVVITPNEELALKIIDYREDYKLKFEKLIVLKIDANDSLLIDKNHSTDSSLIYEDDDLLFSSKIKDISDNREIKFPDNLAVNEIFADSDFEVKSYYHPRVPFLLHKEYDGFNIDYLNVNPIIERLNSGDEKSRDFYQYMGKLLEFSEIELPHYKLTGISQYVPFSKGVVAFKNLIFQGNVILESDSAVINLKNNPIIVNLVDSELEFENVSQILPIKIDKVIVNASQGILKGGKGFYSQVSFNQSSVRFEGQPAIISIVDSNGEVNTVTSEEIEINLSESIFLIRQPKVTSDGITEFENFYGFGKVPRKVKFVNENFQINGTETLNIIFSDEFTISIDNSFKGKIIR